jgi:hypothetical protein
MQENTRKIRFYIAFFFLPKILGLFQRNIKKFHVLKNYP